MAKLKKLKSQPSSDTVVALQSVKKKKLGLNKVSKTIKREAKKKQVNKGPEPPAAGPQIDPTELLDELLKTETKKEDTKKLNGFKVIKWRLSSGSDVIHHLFVKKHEVTIADLSREKPPGRTILCHNVPPYLYENHLREIFSPFGTIQKIFVHQNPTTSVPEKYDYLFATEKDTIRGFKVAYVVYVDSKSVQELQELDMNDVEPIVLKKVPTGGVSRWISQYNRRILPTSVLETSVRKFMEDFDKKEIERKEMEKHASEPDDEGWVTVTRTGKRMSGGLVRSEAMEERLREKKRKQDKQLLNFTPAQIKESKMKQLLELKKKFEEDKQRVALLKQQRKFKPF